MERVYRFFDLLQMYSFQGEAMTDNDRCPHCDQPRGTHDDGECAAARGIPR